MTQSNNQAKKPD